MQPRLLLSLPLATALCLIATSPASADTRYLPFTYQYMTPSQGEREVELFTDFNQTAGFENQLELEYGVTDHLALSAYFVAQPVPFQARALQFEGRYRLMEPGVWPVDVALYGEYEANFGEPGNLEAKVILQRDLGPVSLQANLIGEKALSDDPVELRGSGGVAYEVTEDVHPGVELNLDHDVLYAGPTLSLEAGASKATGGVYYSTSGWLGRVILEQEF